MMYCDIQTEPIDKDWLFGFTDEIDEKDYLAIAPYEDEWEVVQSFIDEASEGKGIMYGLEKLCKEFPYVPMGVDKTTGITVGVHPTDYNPRFTNIFHVIYKIKKKYEMKNNQSKNSYYNNNGKAYNGGFNQNPPHTSYMKVDCMGTNSTNFNDEIHNNQQLEEGDIAVLRSAFHEKDEPPKYVDYDYVKNMVKTDQEEKEDGYAFKNGVDNIVLNTEPRDRNWHPNKNQFGKFNSPFSQGINPYQYNAQPNNNSFNSSSYLSGYRGTVSNYPQNMKFSCFNDVYAKRDAQMQQDKLDAARINQQVNLSNPTRLEANYTDFSNPESVNMMQNPYGYLNAYSNPNINGYQQNNGWGQPQYTRQPFSYGPSNNMYNNGYSYSYPMNSYIGNNSDDYMIATDEEIEAGLGLRPYITYGKPDDEPKEIKPHQNYVDKIENVQFKIIIAKSHADGTITDINDKPLSKEKLEELGLEDKGEVKYDIHTGFSKSSVPSNLDKYSSNRSKCGFKVFPDLRKEVEDLCEEIQVYDEAIAIALYASLDDELTYDEFQIYKEWCKEKLEWYKKEEQKHPELDYRVDYRYRPDPAVFNIAGKKIIDGSKPHQDIQPKKYDENGNRVYSFDRGHEITDDEMKVFYDRAILERDKTIISGKQKKIVDKAAELVEEEDDNYNPYDPVSVRIHEIKKQQRQARNQYRFYKKAYRNLMSESQFDNWWFGGQMNVPNVKLTPLQQRMNYVYRMTEMNMNSINTLFAPVDYEARRRAMIAQENKAFRDFDKGCMEGCTSLRDYFDRLGYLMSMVAEDNRKEWMSNKIKQLQRGNHLIFQNNLRNTIHQGYVYNPSDWNGIKPTPYQIQQRYIEFTKSDEYLDKRNKFLTFCKSEAAKHNVPLKPLCV